MIRSITLVTSNELAHEDGRAWYPAVLRVEDRDGVSEVRASWELPKDELAQLAEQMAQRAIIPMQYIHDGRGVAVSVPTDDTYVEASAPVYVVWGPTAEWGDGQGPRFYALDRRSARDWLVSERRDIAELIEEGRRSGEEQPPWPYPGHLYVVQQSLSEFDVPDEVRFRGRDAVLEWLNEP